MKTLRTVAALTCLACLAACSSSGDDPDNSTGPSTAPSSTAPSSTAPTSSAPVAPTSDASSGAGATDASTPPAGDLQQALLTPAEVGTGFAAASDQSDGDSALPCTPKAAALFMQVPPNEKANRNFDSSDGGVGIAEVVAGFADQQTAAKAFQVGSAGFTCSSGTVNGASVKIVKRALTAQPAGSALDAVGAWDFVTSGVKGTAVLVQAGSKIVGLTFVAKPAAGTDTDVGAITDRAATKVVRAG